MQHVQRRAYIVAAVLAAVGVFSVSTLSHAATVRKDESFMESRAPGVLPGYQVVPGPQGVKYTYKMDEGTYNALKPFGIVAKQFTNGTNLYDVVLISSDSHESFHDPKICFSAQGWTFDDMHEETLDVPGRGKIPFTIVSMSGPQNKSFAAYCYRGPSGFVANPKRLQLQMFSEVLFGQKPMDSTFYRFMPASQNTSLEELREFVKLYMSTAPQESGNYY